MFAVSTDGETYRGQFETVEDAIKKAASVCSDGVFFVGECRPPVAPESLWSAEDWLEHVSVQDDYQGDWAEDWDCSVESQREELEAIVRKAMAEWLDKHDLRPTHHCIDEAKQYRIVQGVVSPVAPIELG